MTSLLRRFRPYTLLLPVLLIGLWNAYGNMFTQDDAYISYNYAKWFSRGYGLVWYPGSTEFGYTSFLYTLMIGVGMTLGIAPEVFSSLINTFSFMGCLVLTYVMAMRLLESRLLALLPMLLLATHHTFTAYASGGLETMWVTFLILLFYWHIISRKGRSESAHYLRIGTIAAVALLSRLDTVLLLAPGYLFTLLAGMKGISMQAAEAQIRRMKDALTIPVIVTLGFLLCCALAYGYALPNTFYIKMPGSAKMLDFGMHYLMLYNKLHFYVPFFLPCIIIYFFAKRNSLQRLGRSTLLLGGVLLTWLAYVIYVGGDFMEFRFLVLVLPFYYLVVLRVVLVLLPWRRKVAVLAVSAIFLVGNALHPMLFHTKAGILDFNESPVSFDYAFVESTDNLEEWLTLPRTNWREIGKSLRQLFYSGSADDVVVAVGNTGAIPFYSDLDVFDMLGLNSRVVLTDSRREATRRPGHTMLANTRLFVREKVALNLAFPQYVCRQGARLAWVPHPVRSFPFIRHETLFLPLDNGCFAVADYVTPHPRVEALLKQKTILRYRDVAKDTDCPDWLCVR